jgi:hypothetical protein
MRNERDMSKVLNCLHAKEGFEKASSIGDDPMIGHQDRFMAWNEGNEASCHLVRSCSRIAGQRNDAERHHRLLAQRLIECPACTGAGGRNWRMGMNDSSDIRTMTVDSEMHAYLTGRSSCAFKKLSIVIYDHHVSFFDEVLAHPGWRSQKAMLVQPDGQIARGARGET